MTPERFTAAGLRAALDEALRLLASPLAPLVKPTLAADPDRRDDSTRALARLPAAQPRTMRDGVMFSPEAGAR